VVQASPALCSFPASSDVPLRAAISDEGFAGSGIWMMRGPDRTAVFRKSAGVGASETGFGTRATSRIHD
jgi:hypothetical protein